MINSRAKVELESSGRQEEDAAPQRAFNRDRPRMRLCSPQRGTGHHCTRGCRARRRETGWEW